MNAASWSASLLTHRHWRAAVLELAVFAVLVAVRLSYGTVVLPIVIGLILIWFCYLIAAGGSAPSESAGPKIGGEWARDILARPLWLDTIASTVHYTLIGLVVFWLVNWDDSIPLLPMLFASVVASMLPFAALIALTVNLLERRQARRALRSVAPPP